MILSPTASSCSPSYACADPIEIHHSRWRRMLHATYHHLYACLLCVTVFLILLLCYVSPAFLNDALRRK